VHKSTISRTRSKYHQNPDFYTKTPKAGRPRHFSDYERLLAKRKIRSGSAKTASELQQQCFPHCSVWTVRRELIKLGLPGRHHRAKFLMTKVHKRMQREWAEKHIDWTADDWREVVFSDESKFNLFGSDGIQWCRRGPGEEFNTQNVEHRVKHGGGSIMVWGCMTSRGWGRLHLVQGNMDRFQYVEILKESLLGTLEDQNLKPWHIYFQQDNDPKHVSGHTMKWFEQNCFETLSWPSNSPDMNIIEHAWAYLETQLRKRDPQPTNKQQLWEMLQEEWATMSDNFRDALYNSMPSRLRALKKARGGFTKY
jgi:hypothetical protein